MGLYAQVITDYKVRIALRGLRYARMFRTTQPTGSASALPEIPRVSRCEVGILKHVWFGACVLHRRAIPAWNRRLTGLCAGCRQGWAA